MNLSPSPLLDAEQRAWHYWFSDGLTNVVAGIGCLLLSFCLLYPPHWPPTAPALIAWAAALWLYGVTVLRHRQIVEWLKSRMTYPRTGYTQTPADAICPGPLTLSLRSTALAPDELERFRLQRRKTFYLMLSLIVVSALVELIAIRQRWVWLAAGLIVCAATILARKQFHMSWIVPTGFALLGSLMTLSHPSLNKAPALFFVGWGVIFVLDGTFTLIRYLALNPEPKAPTA
jgi:hypothetical protein